MTCNSYQYQLSLHLDGRLSSAGRHALMRHLDDCSSCQNLWQEMQRAQDLALSLPAQSVGSAFRETLLDRIRSGEGTPEAVFHAPVPKLVKLRYLASGAAAAAVIILSLNWFSDLESVPQGNGKGLKPIEQSGSNSFANLLADGDSWDLESLGIRPFIPINVAEVGARSVTDSVRDLQVQTADLKSRVASTPPRQLLREDAKRAGPISRLRGWVGLMRWMQEGKIISLPPRFASELRLAEAFSNRLQSAESPAEFRFALGGIDQLQVEHMRDNFQVICCQNPEEFYVRFTSVMSRNPDIGRVLQVHVLEPGNTKILNGFRGTNRIVMRVRLRPGTRETRDGGK